MVDHESLIEELKAFRKGRAARRPDFVKRLGPQLRALCGITEFDTAAGARSKLQKTVERFIGDQAPDLLAAALVQFALHPQAVQETLVDRQAWLADAQRFGPRTARRRMDAALEAILLGARDDSAVSAAELAVEPVGSRWRVSSLEAVLHLTTDGPTLVERRVVEFVADGLDEITCRVSVPRPHPADETPRRLLADAVFGVRIVGASRPTDDHYEYRLQLPRRFQAGQRHEYSTRFQIPAGQPMASHYVMQPLTPCDEFRLIVRFDPERPPQEIWTLDGVAPRVIDSDRPPRRSDAAGPPVAPDRIGEVHRSFRRLQQGFAYGVKWRP